MRIILVPLLLQALVRAQETTKCDYMLGDDQTLRCPLPNATITYTYKRNTFVKVYCEDSPINCEDLQPFDLASGLSLRSLGLTNCPSSLLRCINYVVNASDISRVSLVNATEELVAEDVTNLGNVTALFWRRAAAQKSLPISTLKALPSLNEVRIGGAKITLVPFAFERSPNLTYLEFSDDKITSIPTDSFNGLKSLRHLNMWGNNIENITVGAFRGLTNLRKLSLSNQERYIQPGSFDDITKLSCLNVMKVNISILPDGLLQGLTELQNLTWFMNAVELSLDTIALSQLPSLKIVILKWNRIRTLPSTLFKGSNNIEYLDLNLNLIETLPNNVFDSLTSLKMLYLNDNKLGSLSSNVFVMLKRLEHLYMNNNLLEILPPDLFVGLTSLKHIHLDRNKLMSISSTTFSGASKLQVLSLGYNKLSLQKYQEFQHEYYSPLQFLTDIRKLNLTNNEISNIFEDWRMSLLSLEELNLSRNKFTHLMFDNDPDATNFLKSGSLTVDLRHNEIRQISLSRGPFRKDPLPLNQTTTILLNNNPFICDCHMYYIKLRISGDVALKDEPKLVFDNAACFSPQNLKDVPLVNVSVNDLVCELSEDNQTCSTIARPSTNELLLGCSSFPDASMLPDTENKVLSEYFNQKPRINVKSKLPPISLDNMNVTTLDLSNNNMTSLDFKPNDNLKVLNLTNNNITTITTDFLNSNISIYLSNNPIDCSCSNKKVITAIVLNKNIHGATCDKGQHINNMLDLAALCYTDNVILITSSTVLVIAICFIITILIIYIYYDEIIVWLINNNISKCCLVGFVSDKDRKYDAFISFSHEDFDLVEDQLIPLIEKDFGLKACVHYRDWEVGLDINSQIKRSVEKSRKTIIILSKAFIESMWANREFSAAHTLSLQENKPRILLILTDEILKDHPRLSNELKAYISTNTYLFLGDKNFTKKLAKALNSISYKITWLDSLKELKYKSREVGLEDGLLDDKDKKNVDGLNVELVNGKLVNLGS